jgi:hypothetical protein
VQGRLAGVARLPVVGQAMLWMNGTVMIDTITATENTINASLNRQGKRLVQCFVFSKIDIVVCLSCNRSEREFIRDPDPGIRPPRVLIAMV